MNGDIERRTFISDATIEYREGDKKPVISGYAAVFNVESRNLGGFIESIHPNAFDRVLSETPDVIGVFNHDRNNLLGRTGNGTMRLTKDSYGLRYAIDVNENTSVGKNVVEWVKDRTVIGSSFAFAVRRSNGMDGDSWSTDHQRGIRKREVREISLLEDVGPVVRPAYDSSSVVVSRRAIEMALGESFRPVTTMANASKRGLKLAQGREGVDPRLLCVAERVANREIVSVEEVSYLASVYERCLAAKVTGWSGSPAWIEWQLAGGDTGEKWVARRAASDQAQEPDQAPPPSIEPRSEPQISLVPTSGMAAAAKRGLALHEAGRSGDGLKPETVARAKKIASRDELTPEHVREMRAWFRRHKVDKKPGWNARGEETPGYTAWQLWGSDAAWRWSEAKVRQMEGEKRDAGEMDEGVEEQYPGTISPANLMLAEAEESIADEAGKWPQEGPAGAHYMEASPFAERGMKCANCVFYEGGGACEIVNGEIASEGLCKLWIIPEERMSEEKKPETPAEPPAPPAPTNERSAEEKQNEEIAVKIATLQGTILRTQLHAM